MKRKIKEYTTFALIILLLIFMIISSIKITYNSMTLSTYSNYLAIFGILLVINYLFCKISDKSISKYELFIYASIILAIFSLTTTINMHDALFGKIRRNEGLFVIITYYLLSLNSMNINNKKMIKTIIIIIMTYSVINIIYGMWQTEMLNSFKLDIRNSWHYARGFLGNSMYFGTLMSIFYGLSIGLFINGHNKVKKLISIILVVLSTIGIIISGAMSSYVAVIVSWIIISINHIYYDIIKNKNYNFIYSLLIVLFIFIIILNLNTKRNNELKSDLLELKEQATNVSKGKLESNYGTGRIYIWKNTIKKIEERKGIGVGIDNFYNAFEGKLVDSKSGLPVDKAHNDYLQKILCEGIISGILFVIFLFMIFKNNILKNHESINFGLFLAFVSYSTQAFFNISVTRVAPIYFIIIGLLLRKEIIHEKN